MLPFYESAEPNIPAATRAGARNLGTAVRHGGRREQPAQEFEAADHRAAVRVLGEITGFPTPPLQRARAPGGGVRDRDTAITRVCEGAAARVFQRLLPEQPTAEKCVEEPG